MRPGRSGIVASTGMPSTSPSSRWSVMPGRSWSRASAAITAMKIATKNARIVLRSGRGESAPPGRSASRAICRSVPALVAWTDSSARRSRSARCWAWPDAVLASAELEMASIWLCNASCARLRDALSAFAWSARNAFDTALAMSAAEAAVASVAVTVMMFAFGSSVEATLLWSSWRVRPSDLPAAWRTVGEVISVWIVARSRCSELASDATSVEELSGVTMIWLSAL